MKVLYSFAQHNSRSPKFSNLGMACAIWCAQSMVMYSTPNRKSLRYSTAIYVSKIKMVILMSFSTMFCFYVQCCRNCTAMTVWSRPLCLPLWPPGQGWLTPCTPGQTEYTHCRQISTSTGTRPTQSANHRPRLWAPRPNNQSSAFSHGSRGLGGGTFLISMWREARPGSNSALLVLTWPITMTGVQQTACLRRRCKCLHGREKTRWTWFRRKVRLCPATARSLRHHALGYRTFLATPLASDIAIAVFLNRLT